MLPLPSLPPPVAPLPPPPPPPLYGDDAQTFEQGAQAHSQYPTNEGWFRGHNVRRVLADERFDEQRKSPPGEEAALNDHANTSKGGQHFSNESWFPASYGHNVRRVLKAEYVH